jgi:hypothetical protein
MRLGLSLRRISYNTVAASSPSYCGALVVISYFQLAIRTTVHGTVMNGGCSGLSFACAISYHSRLSSITVDSYSSPTICPDGTGLLLLISWLIAIDLWLQSIGRDALAAGVNARGALGPCCRHKEQCSQWD